MAVATAIFRALPLVVAAAGMSVSSIALYLFLSGGACSVGRTVSAPPTSVSCFG